MNHAWAVGADQSMVCRLGLVHIRPHVYGKSVAGLNTGCSRIAISFHEIKPVGPALQPYKPPKPWAFYSLAELDRSCDHLLMRADEPNWVDT